MRSALREPVSFRQAAALLLGLAYVVAAQCWAEGTVRPEYLWAGALLLQFAVQPVSTLVHELGHAAAVVRLGRRPVRIVIGRGPWLPARMGRLRVLFSVLPTRGVRILGFCHYDGKDLSWRSVGWIALAGPLASLAELAVVLAAATAPWH